MASSTRYDGEDEGEKRDPVQGVAIEIEYCQRQGESDRNSERYDARLAPPQGEHIRRVTETMAMNMCSRSSFDFSSAVSP